MLGRLTVLTALLILPVAVHAQAFTPTSRSDAYPYLSQQWSMSVVNAQPAPRAYEPDRQCLINKKTGKTECHTYAEWVEIARALTTAGK